MRFWPVFFGAFYSPQRYAQVRYRAQGWGLWYAFQVVGLTTLLGVGMLAFAFHHYLFTPRNGQAPLVDRAIMQIAQQLPPFTLDQGMLRIDQDGPQIITLALDELAEPVAVFTIDTTGQTTSATMQTYVLVTDSHIISRQSDGRITEEPLAKLTRNQPGLQVATHEEMVRQGQRLVELLHARAWKIYAVLVPLAWIGVTAVFFITRSFMLLALGLCAMMLSSITGRMMNYVDSVRVASMAYTPVAVFSALAFLAGFMAIGSATLFALGIFMLFCVISATKDEA